MLRFLSKTIPYDLGGEGMAYSELLVNRFMKELEDNIPSEVDRELKAISLVKIAYSVFEHMIEHTEHKKRRRGEKSEREETTQK